MKTEPVKIQINSLDALERLIGGDSALEFEIRQNVAESFCKKYLKALATEDVLKKIHAQIVNEIQEKIFTIIPDKNYHWQQTIILKDDAKREILRNIDTWVSNQITTTIKDYLERTKITDRINSELERQSAYIFNELTSANLMARINALVDHKIKTKLGL